MIESDIPKFKHTTTVLQSACPIDENHIEVRMRIFQSHAPPLSFLLKLTRPILSYLNLHALRLFLGEDAYIWNHKKYLTQLQLTPEDGPIPAFRRWARQFYD